VRLAAKEGRMVHSRNVHADPRCTLESAAGGLCSFARCRRKQGRDSGGAWDRVGHGRNFEEQAQLLER